MVNFQITQGTGTTIATDTGGGGENYQKIKLIDATTGATQGTGISTNPLQVSLANTGSNATAIVVDGSAVTQPISAVSLPLPTNAAQETGGNLDSIKSDLDQFTFVASKLIVDGSGVIQPVSGTITANAGTGNFTVVQSVGANLHVDVDNFPATQPVSGTVTANAGTGTFTVGQATGTNLHTVVDSGSITVANSTLAVTQSTSPWVVSLTSTTITGTVTVAGNLTHNNAAPTANNVGVLPAVASSSIPTYNAGDQVLLSTDLSGNLRVTIDSSASEQNVNLNQVGGSAISIGQAAMAASLPVVLASNQSSIPVTLTSTTITGTVAVTQSTSPWVVSGTVTANIGTTNGLALDSSVTGLQVSQGSTTSGQKGELIQGAVTTSAPTYTTAQTSPLSLTTSGALRTDSSATTQPISVASLPLPTGAATSANQTNGSQQTLIVQGGNTAIVDATGDLQVDVNNFPATQAVTQSGIWTVQPGNTANTTPWLTTLNQGGNSATVTAANALKVDGSAVTQPISGTVTANAGTGTFTVGQATGTNLHTVVDSGSIAATQSGTWSTRTQDGSGNSITSTSNALDVNLKTSSITLNTKDSADGPVTPGAVASNSILIGGQYNTTPPAPTNGQQVALQVSGAGELITGTNDDMYGTINITAQDTVTTSTTGANGQVIYTGTPTAGSTAAFVLSSDQAMTLEVSGTWTGTLQVEVSMDNGTTWFQRTLHQTGTNFTSASFTANFTGAANIAGYTNLRVRAIAAWTGTATIRANSTSNVNILYVDSGVKVTDNNGNIASISSKGAQATNFVGVQDAKDSGRTYVTFTADAVVGVTSETLLTMTQNRQGSTTSASTYNITSGKTLRIQSITVGIQSGAGAGEWVRVKLRHNTAGATTTSSSLVYTTACGSPQNQAATGGQVSAAIPDGLEFYGDGTQTIGISHISSAITNVESVTICGYEY